MKIKKGTALDKPLKKYELPKGFYWVKRYFHSEWEVAYWNTDVWLFAGFDEGIYEVCTVSDKVVKSSCPVSD